ncbi:MAG: GNAT family N-acetyltransferase [Acidobacteriota bacterium]|nr:GNAT family N-acetyltransferase [Acidobacteriota bacterium]
MPEEAWNLSIRRALPEEAALLSDLALRSKAHWGYTEEFLEACRAELTLSPEYIAASPVFVLEEDKRIVGFYGLREREEDIELAYLFVEPSAVNRGYGKRLWQHLVGTATKLSPKRISIESDPFAESFYKRMGARAVGFVSSTVQADRKLPLLEFHLS